MLLRNFENYGGISTSMILITGATGTNGTALCSLLSKRGVPFRAMVRDAKSARPKGAEVVQADFNDPTSLQKALAGVDHAFLVTSPSPDASKLEINFIQAAKQAGVQHIVKASVMDADGNGPSRFQTVNSEAEEALKASGLGWTMVRPNLFMQTVGGAVQGDAMYTTAGDARVSVVHSHDIAHVAAAALTEAGHEGQSYDVTGPEALTHTEMAERSAIRCVKVSTDQARAALLGAGLPAWNVEGILELDQWYQTGRAARISTAVHDVGGTTPRTFQQFAEEWAKSRTAN